MYYFVKKFILIVTPVAEFRHLGEEPFGELGIFIMGFSMAGGAAHCSSRMNDLGVHSRCRNMA
jgi:hypothetical protein